MGRGRWIAAVLVASLTLLGVAFTRTTAEAAVVAPSLAIARDFPDPDVVRFGRTYYAYSTNSGGPNVPVASATSVNGPWTARGDALPRLGAWASGGLTWAPDVSRRADGRYLLYYTAHSVAINRQCIGAALATWPLGPFEPVGTGPLVCDAGDAGDIDPSSFVDTDGRRYLLYKNDGNAVGGTTSIWLQEVAADGLGFIGGRTGLIHNDRAEEAGVIEAPTLVKRNGRYVLFYSGGSYGGDGYFTSYATADAIGGPYQKAYRPLLTTASLNGTVHGPGGQDIVTVGSQDVIVFHGWINGHTARGMYVAAVGWVAGGYPVVRGSRVRYEAEGGALNNCRVRTGAIGASQGAVVAYIDFPDSYVDIPVFAPRSGDYSAFIGYAAGFGDAEHLLTVNGGAPVVVGYPNRGWDNWTEVEVGVSLNAGWNTLRLQNRTAWAELDYVELA
jgi:arabinan endo-1,5-alpha-L-arabinosidase